MSEFITAAEMADLAKRPKAAADRLARHTRAALTAYIALGAALAPLRPQFKARGSWGEFCEHHVGISRKVAENALKLHTRRDRLPALDGLTVTEALAAVAYPEAMPDAPAGGTLTIPTVMIEDADVVSETAPVPEAQMSPEAQPDPEKVIPLHGRIAAAVASPGPKMQEAPATPPKGEPDADTRAIAREHGARPVSPTFTAPRPKEPELVEMPPMRRLGPATAAVDRVLRERSGIDAYRRGLMEVRDFIEDDDVREAIDRLLERGPKAY